MTKLEDKIKALLIDESIENMVPPVDDDEGFNDSCRDVSIGLAQQWRDEIAKLYAEQYGETWEQFVEHCRNTYPHDAATCDERSCEKWITIAHVSFHKSGDVVYHYFASEVIDLTKETYIKFGRYLEGVNDE